MNKNIYNLIYTNIFTLIKRQIICQLALYCWH